MVPQGPDLDEVLNTFFRNLRQVAIAALVKKEITEHEKFALCWASGVPVEYVDGKFKTQVKCGVVHDGERWQIFRGAETKT